MTYLEKIAIRLADAGSGWSAYGKSHDAIANLAQRDATGVYDESPAANALRQKKWEYDISNEKAYGKPIIRAEFSKEDWDNARLAAEQQQAAANPDLGGAVMSWLMGLVGQSAAGFGPAITGIGKKILGEGGIAPQVPGRPSVRFTPGRRG